MASRGHGNVGSAATQGRIGVLLTPIRCRSRSPLVRCHALSAHRERHPPESSLHTERLPLSGRTAATRRPRGPSGPVCGRVAGPDRTAPGGGKDKDGGRGNSGGGGVYRPTDGRSPLAPSVSRASPVATVLPPPSPPAGGSSHALPRGASRAGGQARARTPLERRHVALAPPPRR